MKNRVAEATLSVCGLKTFQAAFNHIAVSNALLISGMFMPKVEFAAAAAAFDALLLLAPASLVGATSAARSHDPISWERATEKNRNI